MGVSYSVPRGYSVQGKSVLLGISSPYLGFMLLVATNVQYCNIQFSALIKDYFIIK